MKKKVVSFLVSGRGSNFKIIAEKILSGGINAVPGIVISNVPDVKALETAEKLKIKSFVVDSKKYSVRKEHEKEIVKLLKELIILT